MHRTILVLNVGSSSVKFAVAQGRRMVVRGEIDHFGPTACVRFVVGRRKRQWVAAVPNLGQALAFVRRHIAELNIRPDLVAHRIVHGGQRYSRPTRLTAPAIRHLHELVALAPLHQPANLQGVTFAAHAWPTAAQWGVFDTAIYRSLPTYARTYALPRKLSQRLRIEKYGFHGLSHAWAFFQAAKKLRVPDRQLSAVTVHLGAGASATLWEQGRAVDTSMGFTPLEGLVMATRCGDIDPAIPLYIQEQLGWSAQRVHNMLEHESGLVGLCGMKDMRDVLAAAGLPVTGWTAKHASAAVRRRAKLALEVFLYRLRKYVASYAGLVPNVRAVIFTGPTGENRDIQRLVLSHLPAAHGLKWLTVAADEEQHMLNSLSL